ncbi:hypothetical protein CNMCM5623_004323 [Aspergillus felis]|uniref:Uncharacterized protein n=1 Tax=Aspergillus felis TaxID=1287682 RepID=A0A8H6PQG8_9EURO|nr:hypothetical protein CNMCM5623_004323 [Aspergillus felis]KAF7176972.1 hypothetical protein CNMCM7691_004397 [Aspergillus felis]
MHGVAVAPVQHALMYLNKSCRSTYIDYTLRGVLALVPILPPPGPPSPSPKRFHGRATARSFRDDTEVDELRLSDVGEESLDDSADEAAFLAVRAAAAGLQCAQTKMPKPRPLQLAHAAPLPGVRFGAIYSSETACRMYLGALPAQSRQVKTVRPPMQESLESIILFRSLPVANQLPSSESENRRNQRRSAALAGGSGTIEATPKRPNGPEDTRSRSPGKSDFRKVET